MEIIKYSEFIDLDEAMKNNEPLLAVISFDCKIAIFSHIDEAVEHHILLQKAGYKSTEIDKFFRIIFDKNGADWTFVCPIGYKNVEDKTRRISEFYKDGFTAISNFLSQIGYFPDINIPKRYRDVLNNSSHISL